MNGPSPSSGTTPALQGALLAFQKGQLPPPRETRLAPGTSRARSRERSPRGLSPHHTGPSRARPDISPSRSHDISGVSVSAPRRSSPARTGDSFIAANLAAGPLSPARTGTGTVPVDASRSPRADTRPIPSAAKLISMFEGTEGRGGVAPRAKTPTSDRGGDPVKVDAPMTPVGAARTGELAKRAGTPGGKPETSEASAAGRPPVVRPKPAVDAALLAARQVASPPAVERAETSLAGGPKAAYAAKAERDGEGDLKRAITPSPSPSISATKKDHPVILEPEAGRQRRGSASSEDTFVSASSVQSPAPSPPPSPTRLVRPPRTPTRTPNKSASVSPARRPAPPPRRNPAGASLNATALSTAIVAGSLASSRLTPSNTGGEAATTPQKHQPSPRLLQTLRTGDSDHAHRHRHQDDEEEEKMRKNGLRGKRHKHHEGARKRWAARVSERQRKRYEALWASNRGLFVEEHLASSSSPLGAHEGVVDPGDYVVNVVVRQLWRRSRLPDDELEEVWALVDAEGRGVLGRREFVVGTWLVDQRLRGRKIPARVGDSVWDSASGMASRR